TDFVAKNEKFQNYVEAVAKQIAASDAKDVEALLTEKWLEDPEKTVNDALVNMIATIGEKISIRRFEKIVSDDVVVPYIHGGGRIGVLVEAKAVNDDANKEALKNIAMQVAAMNPEYISRADMSDEALANLKGITIDGALNTPDTLPKPILNRLIARACDEKVWSDEDIKIYGEQKNNMNYLFNFLSDAAKAQLAGLANEEKEAIVGDKIFNGLVEGRFAKQLKDICLLDQVYVKAEDGKQSVAAYLKSVNPELSIKKIVRFETGEGIEKKQENFAEEVAKQMQ
ncbi:MAG: translation elongation factor Ts, partial [Lachnospiraceae bacterium]|nr:translation elongation factor Ts [Lachnospiraceae bacterium]